MAINLSQFGTPGPQGATGSTGATGATGATGSAGHGSTTTTATVTFPAVNSTVSVPVTDGAAFANLAYCVLTNGSSGFSGQVTSGGGTNTLTVKNLATIAGTSCSSGAVLTFSGVQGTQGATGPTGATGATGGDSLLYGAVTVPSGNTIANTVSATNFSSIYTIPTNSLAVGQLIRIRAWGVYSTDTIAPTITLDLRFRLVTIATSGAVTLTASQTNKGWYYEADAMVTAIGTSGSLEVQGAGNFYTSTTPTPISTPNTAAVTVNTALTSNVVLRVTWGAASVNNTITLRNFEIFLDTAQNSS